MSRSYLMQVFSVGNINLQWQFYNVFMEVTKMPFEMTSVLLFRQIWVWSRRKMVGSIIACHNLQLHVITVVNACLYILSLLHQRCYLQCLLFIYFFCCECVLTIEEVIVSCRYSTSAWFSIRQSQISHKVNLWVNWDNIIISIAILTVTFLLSGMPGPKLLGKARRILRSACKRNHTNTRHKSSN